MMTMIRPLTRVRSDLNSIFEEMDTMLKPFLATRHPEIQEHLNSWFPSLDVVENDENLVLKAAIPGYSPDEINIEVEGNTIVISGESHPQADDTDTSRYLLREIVSGRFTRKLQLPYDVQSDNATAQFNHGVLVVILPKVARSRKINIDIQR